MARCAALEKDGIPLRVVGCQRLRIAKDGSATPKKDEFKTQLMKLAKRRKKRREWNPTDAFNAGPTWNGCAGTV
jgi:hypothetical protein